jgi:hypothetical protein
MATQTLDAPGLDFEIQDLWTAHVSILRLGFTQSQLSYFFGDGLGCCDP